MPQNIGWGHSPNQIGGHFVVASKWSFKMKIYVVAYL
jgi:hypothetical protein